MLFGLAALFVLAPPFPLPLWTCFARPYWRRQCCGSGSTGSTCFWASWIRIQIHQSEVWIRLRIWILLSPSKKVRKTLIPNASWLLFDFLSSKSNKQKNFFLNLFFVGILGSSMTKISGSGSISQRQGSADPDPDPPQNVMDPQHWT